VPTQYGENVVIRVLDKRSEVLTLPSLGYNPQYTEQLLDALEKPTGIFLVTGPTGSGKSTTLYAVLGYLNRPEVKTLTVEDPIEYSINGITQTEVNDQIGNTFSRLLRAFLRQDPDNIMIGEIRDTETANIAIKAALTGHTVLSTLHTNDATSAITRLLDMGLEPSLLVATLRGVLAQRLVRCNCKECLEPYSPSELAEREFAPIMSEYEGIFYHGVGCAACNFTGYKGRLPIAELWLPAHEELMIISHISQAGNLREKVFGGNKRVTMIQDGLRLVKEGQTTLEELIRVVPSEQFNEWRGQYSADATI
jgi:type IV pilus assembly protein PilB